jgi:hypothetical protein
MLCESTIYETGGVILQYALLYHIQSHHTLKGLDIWLDAFDWYITVLIWTNVNYLFLQNMDFKITRTLKVLFSHCILLYLKLNHQNISKNVDIWLNDHCLIYNKVNNINVSNSINVMNVCEHLHLPLTWPNWERELQDNKKITTKIICTNTASSYTKVTT